MDQLGAQTAVQTSQAVATSRDLVELLARTSTYPERPSRVEVVETHISWVFLTDRFAYKLKKPVQYEFLDFSTPELRHEACQEEVRLNRRLAPAVYLDVIPVNSSRRGRLSLGGPGTARDWVVKMRRLQTARRLDRLIANSQLSSSAIQLLAGRLSSFYQNLPPLTTRTEEYRAEIERHVRANRDELLKPIHGLSKAQVKRVHGSQLRLLKLAPWQFDDRVCDGRIIDGHGDLRPEHIYLIPAPTIIDCVEFNDEFRKLDVADELSFLQMELDCLGAPAVGESIVESYFQLGHDRPPRSLLGFYKSYRACVRGKVHVLRAAQLDHPLRSSMLEVAEKYMRLAETYEHELGNPVLIVVRGLMGTGKSTLARRISGELGTELLQTDAIRQEMFGNSESPVSYGKHHYQEEKRLSVYNEMLDRAAALVKNGMTVILDGTFPTSQLIARAMQVGSRCGARTLVVDCHCPDHIAKQRIAERVQRGGAQSEARPELFDQQKADEQHGLDDLTSCSVDTTESLQSMIQRVLASLPSDYRLQA